MKKHHIILFFFLLALFASCHKTAETPLTNEIKVALMLTGMGNKVWKLNKVYVNNVQQGLSDSQLKYAKTYTADPTNGDPSKAQVGTFTNSDGLIGKWRVISNGDQIYETYTNNLGGPVAVTYLINAISEQSIDLEYTANMKTIREVYHAF